MRERIEQAQARLRKAVAAADYQGAGEALEQLRAVVEEAVRARASAGEWMREVVAELEQVRRLALAARAHDAARLAQLKRPLAGYTDNSATPHCLRLEA